MFPYQGGNAVWDSLFFFSLSILPISFPLWNCDGNHDVYSLKDRNDVQVVGNFLCVDELSSCGAHVMMVMKTLCGASVVMERDKSCYDCICDTLEAEEELWCTDQASPVFEAV